MPTKVVFYTAGLVPTQTTVEYIAVHCCYFFFAQYYVNHVQQNNCIENSTCYLKPN